MNVSVFDHEDSTQGIMTNPRRMTRSIKQTRGLITARGEQNVMNALRIEILKKNSGMRQFLGWLFFLVHRKRKSLFFY